MLFDTCLSFGRLELLWSRAISDLDRQLFSLVGLCNNPIRPNNIMSSEVIIIALKGSSLNVVKVPYLNVVRILG